MKTLTRILGGGALFGVAFSLPVQAGPRGFAYNADGQLFSFDLHRPSEPVAVGTAVGGNVRGLDLRPSTSTLYALDVGGTNAQLYTVNPSTGARTAVGAGFAVSGTVGGNGYSLDPTAAYGFDFNPATLQGDGSIRIRLVNSAGADLRLNSDTGAIAAVDGVLQYSGGSPATVAVGGAAYLNTDTARVPGTSPATQLFYLETANDNLVTIQSPADPNAGVFTTVGPLGADLGATAGFDIFTGNGQNKAYATVTLSGAAAATLHTINLSTGAASASLGSFPSEFQPAGGFAIVNMDDPTPTNIFGYSYNAAGQLFVFDVNNPAGARAIGASGVGGTVKGLDFRPGTTTLYAIEVNADTAQLYTVNLSTGARTPVGSGFANSGTVGGNNYALNSAASYGFDFNPTTLQVDGSVRIRFVNSEGVDLRLNSDTGAIAAVDGTLVYASGDPANSDVTAAAYTNSDTARTASTAPGTLLYYLDTLNDNLVNLPSSPNSGQFQLVGSLGVNVADVAGFDIVYAQNANVGYIAVNANGSYTLHRVNLVTGEAGPSLGTFPSGFEPVAGLAIAVIPSSATTDATRPVVRITSPSDARTVVFRPSFRLRGTASDNVGVARVQVKIGNKAYRNVGGRLSRWSKVVNLKRGVNVVRVRAQDAAGNVSAVRTVRFVRR